MFTEKAKMVVFDDIRGIPFVELTFHDDGKQIWIWDPLLKTWTQEVYKDGK